MAQVNIEAVALPQKDAEASTACPSCPLETKNKEVGDGDQVEKKIPPPSSDCPCLSLKRWLLEDCRWAIVLIFFIGIAIFSVTLAYCHLHVQEGKSAPIEALRCIRIHYDPIKGEYECINWDIKSVSLVGTRRIVPNTVDGYDANKIELYSYGSNADFAVYTPIEFEHISVVIHNGVRNGQSVARYEVIVTGPIYNYGARSLDNELASRLIAATVAGNDPQEKKEDEATTWMQELIKAMLAHSPSTNVAIGCEARRLELGEFRLPNPFVRLTNNVLFVGDDIVHVSHKVYQALLDLSNNAGLAEESYVLTGMPIKATVVLMPRLSVYSFNRFKLTVQLPVAKYCRRQNQ